MSKILARVYSPLRRGKSTRSTMVVNRGLERIERRVEDDRRRIEGNQQTRDLPWGRTVSRRTIWRPALIIQSFIRICGRPLVWFAMANEFCRLGQLDISYSQGSATRNPVNAPLVFQPLYSLLVRSFSTAVRALPLYMYIYIYIYLYIYIDI